MIIQDSKKIFQGKQRENISKEKFTVAIKLLNQKTVITNKNINTQSDLPYS